MADAFQNAADVVSAPATRALAVVPSDTDSLPDIPKALFVGTGGTIVMRGANGGADQTWKNVGSGTVLPFRARFIRATGTSATDLLALY